MPTQSGLRTTIATLTSIGFIRIYSGHESSVTEKASRLPKGKWPSFTHHWKETQSTYLLECGSVLLVPMQTAFSSARHAFSVNSAFLMFPGIWTTSDVKLQQRSVKTKDVGTTTSWHDKNISKGITPSKERASLADSSAANSPVHCGMEESLHFRKLLSFHDVENGYCASVSSAANQPRKG